MILTPAYGRDYKSMKELLADLNAGKDFVANEALRQGYVNAEQLKELGLSSVQVRYSSLRKTGMVRRKKDSSVWA